MEKKIGNTILYKVVEDLCKEKNIEFKLLSDDWVIELKKDNKIRHIVKNRFELNGESVGIIASDKYATFQVLKSNDVPVIEYDILYNPVSRRNYIPDGGNESVVQKYLDNFKKVVIKPNDGLEGKDVFLCTNMNEANEALNCIYEKDNSLNISPYYDIDIEYRTFYLDGKIELVYGKQKAFILGDGIRTIREILKSKNKNINLIYKEMNKIMKFDLDYIPQVNEKVIISWKHNLCNGAIPSILFECELRDKIEKIAKEAAYALNIKFATIDIIYTKQKELYVLEVNSGVCMTKFVELVQDGEEYARKIYGRALDMMFEDK